MSGAAEILGLSPIGVIALHEAGFLVVAEGIEASETTFLLTDVKALSARLTGVASEESIEATFREEMDFFDELEMEASAPVDLTVLVALLNEQSGDMAARAYISLCRVYEPASSWTIEQRARFIDQTSARFEAIFAMVMAGDDIDLAGELSDVGAVAAASGSSLPELLATLRISRDLIVDSAVELLEMSPQQWAEAFPALVARILPTIDRLTDAISRGYWAALMSSDRGALTVLRHESAVAGDGLYVVDLDGNIRSANPALAVQVGWPLASLTATSLSEVFVPAESSSVVERLMADANPQLVTLRATRPDGVLKRFVIGTSVRRDSKGEAVAFHGLVRDVSWVDYEGVWSADDLALLSRPSVPLQFDLVDVVRECCPSLEADQIAKLPQRILAVGDRFLACRLVSGVAQILISQSLRVDSLEVENDEWWVGLRWVIDGGLLMQDDVVASLVAMAQAHGGNLKYDQTLTPGGTQSSSLLLTLPTPALVR